ncbi:MAG: glycosyltransferase [Clostridiales bacterium]|nr:glycosyltransferase [Clostridiales bacterium]
MPVYNCEAYLAESLDSVLHQTLKEWELLCVDDGSSDGSLELLKQYQSMDERIHIFMQPNQGAGVARNLGLQHAQGEYIAFLDADDFFFDADALEQMYEACNRYHVDACGSTIKLLRNGVLAEDTELKEVKRTSSNEQVLNYKDFQFDYGYCGFIYKAKIIKEQKISFPPYRRFEDPPFFVRLMHQIQRFTFLNKALYCYRTPNVATRFDTKKTVDLLKGLLDNLEFATLNNLNILFERTLQRLEMEYGNIICYNITPDNTNILELLLRSNHLVRQVKQEEGYVIFPLQKVLQGVIEAERYQKEKLYEQMQNCRQIYLYGAGSAATGFLTYLQKAGLFEKVIAILVTCKEGNPKEIKGVPVISIDDYRYIEGDLVLVTVTNIHCEEIVCKLQEMKVIAFELVDVGMLSE